MATASTIRQRLINIARDSFRDGTLFSFIDKEMFNTILAMAPKKMPRYEVNGLREYARGILDFKYNEAYNNNHFYLCKDNKWRCKGFYTYQSQPDLPTCVTDILVSVYPKDITSPFVKVWSITNGDLEKCLDIDRASSIPVFEIEYGVLNDERLPKAIRIKPCFDNPIIPVSRKELESGINLK